MEIEEYIKHQLDEDIALDNKPTNKKKKINRLSGRMRTSTIGGFHRALRLGKEKEGYTLRVNHPFYGWL